MKSKPTPSNFSLKNSKVSVTIVSNNGIDAMRETM